ncbi:MAG: universal stress protein [Pseudomonadota bacterium]
MTAPAPILAATDFSVAAGHAIERAARLARELGRPLHLLHVYNDFAWANLRALVRLPPGADAEARARARLADLAGILAARHGLAAVEQAVVTGRAAAGIAARAREIGAGLVVLGAHGEGIVQELALGGTAIRVLRASPCPVLVTRQPSERPYARVLVASDFSATATRALRLALALFPGAALNTMHAYSADQEGRMRLAGAGQADIERYRAQAREVAERAMAAFVADADVLAAGSVAAKVGFGYAATVILEEVQRHDIDLLIVGKHGASALDEWVMGSVTLNLMHHATCDVLMVP